jgi:hypothetical protein
MCFKLGYVLFSKAISARLKRDPVFGGDLGAALHKHLRSYRVDRPSLIPGMLENGALLKTYFNDIVIVTQKDLNKNPRTSVVFREEIGV